ncbi:cation diffusion facilitator family transporter [Collinsella intestinalis]|uniref:cation diffusion facilitator family transporter n=1 Tax=Collinsella intestinalis TaxID=147207 RepID=UPI00195B8CE5|nr:cation diffusion facilitator family transporter [Collinsella intestinalis]MBM6907278.1 cation transporter [Collinsella intestinalis]
MIDWLIRRFVAGADNVQDPAVRTRYGQFAGTVGIICNVALCLAKGAVGLIAGSVSIVADAVNNLSDASSNVISLLGFKLASRPADPEHPYGHGRYEYLSGLIVAALVLAIGFELVKSSIEKILSPTPVEFSGALVIVLALSIAVKLWMAVFNRTIGRRIGSETLEATAVDSRNDVISTGAVLVSAVIAHLTGLDLDGWVGCAVGLFILWSGIGLVRETVDPLLGQAPSPELVDHIRTKIMSYPGVLGTHDLMVHDYGPGRQFASAHVEMAAEADPLESHDLIDNIEQDFKTDDRMIVTLHYDPIVTDDPAVNDMRNWINQAVKIIDPRLSIHDLRTVVGPTHTNVIFDCVRPQDLTMPASQLKRRIDQIVRDHYPRCRCVITIDESYVSSAQ